MKKTIPLLASVAVELCLATPLVAATARTATENFVTNKIAAAISQIPPPDYSTNNVALVETIEAKAPTPDLSPFLRKDLGQVGWQEFGGYLSGTGFHAGSELSNFNGWNNYTAKNGPLQPYQALPTYIQSNPWGFALTNDFVRKTGDTMTGALIIKNDDDILDINQENIYFSGSTGVNYIYWPDNIYGSGEIGYGDLHYRGAFDIFATREWADHWAHATVSNTVPAWARAATKPAYTADEVGAYSTGAVDTILRDYLPLDYFRDGQTIPMYYGDDTKLCDFGANWIGDLATGVQNNSDAIAGKQDNLPYPTNAIPYAAISGKPSLATVATSGSYNDLSNKPTIPTVPTNVSSFNNDAGYLTGYTESDPTISAWAKAASKPSYTASDVGAYSSADGTSLANIVNLWEGYWDGTNVIFEVTNYYGNTSGEIPRLRIKELREGTWQTVWDEANKFQVCETNIMSNVVAYVTGEVDGVKNYASGNFAPIAWGTVTDKGTTNVVGNSVWMTAPETYFAGGTEYQRVAVGSGMICVLTDNGALAKTTGEPGTFRFQDEGGTNYFGFAKSDSYTIGCNTDGITVEGTLVTLRYDVIMGGGDVPIVYWRQSLTSGEWVQLNTADGTATQGAPYTVTWYTSGGSYYAAINCGANASGFFKAETSVAGDVVFETNMKMRIDGGLECPNTATGVMGVVRPSYNGSTVIWTWSAK